MQLEKQVCSLELSKRLRELGVKQESVFYWNLKNKITKTADIYDWVFGTTPVGTEYSRKKVIGRNVSAFTVAELGEMLPAGISERRNGNNTHETAVDVSWGLNISPKWGKNDMRYVLYLSGDNHYVQDDSEANARAKMLIYLLDNKLISKE